MADVNMLKAGPSCGIKPRRGRGLTHEEITFLLEKPDSDWSDFSDSDSEFMPQNTIESSSSSSEEEETILSPNISKSKIIWKSKKIDPKIISDDDLPSISHGQPLCPLKYFEKFLSDDFWKLVEEQSNLYSVQKKYKSIKTCVKEIKVFVGIHLIMGVMKIPQARMYWAKHTAVVPLICENMKRDRFFELRNSLHFVDENSNINKQDKLWKVRPLLDTVRKACLEIPKSNHLSIDEQMIPFSGKCVARQYVPSKPNPLGLKNFILASKDGLVLDFVIYQGKGTVSEDDMKTFGLGGAIVKKLSETLINSNYQHVIYTDRFFTGINIAEYLLHKGIYFTGTIMSNRTQSGAQKLPADKKMSRGDCVELCTMDDKMALIKWKDNKTVLLLSTFCGSEPSDHCKRWSKLDCKKIEVPRPACIRLYNAYMGGIDLQDRFIALYRTIIRTKKWTVRVFAHFLDLCIVNSWIMYVRDCNKCFYRKKDKLTLLQFRMTVAELMIKGENKRNSVGRPSLSDNSLNDSENQCSKRRKVIPLPDNMIRFDSIDHLPKAMKGVNQSRCRMEGCNGKSRIKCIKCDVYLCLLNNDCFYRFHASQ